MFAATCTSCATRSIIPESRIVGISRSAAGHTLRYRCWCGSESTLFTPTHRRAGPRTRRGERPEPLPHVGSCLVG